MHDLGKTEPQPGMLFANQATHQQPVLTDTRYEQLKRKVITNLVKEGYTDSADQFNILERMASEIAPESSVKIQNSIKKLFGSGYDSFITELDVDKFLSKIVRKRILYPPEVKDIPSIAPKRERAAKLAEVLAIKFDSVSREVKKCMHEGICRELSAIGQPALTGLIVRP